MKKIISFLLCMIIASTSLAIEFYKNGDRSVPKIAITVDDCYRKDIVEQMMDAAIAHNAKITFFIVGQSLNGDADERLVLKMLDNGFEIGNHSNTHHNMRHWKVKQIKSDFNHFQKRLDKVLGFRYKPNLIRFPYGIGGIKPGLKNYNRACKALGYKYCIYWDVVLDSKEKMLSRIQNGSIILFHANKKDLEVLKELLPELEKKYEMTTVSELLNIPPVEYDKGGL